MNHRLRHPEPVADCFGCKALEIGFQGLRSRHGADPVQKSLVIGEQGARAGKAVGRSAVHWDGRQDTTVYAPKLTIETKVRETW